MSNCEISREMTFEEEAALYEKEAREMFVRENHSCGDSEENSTIRRGMRIIRKAREEIKHNSRPKRSIP